MSDQGTKQTTQHYAAGGSGLSLQVHIPPRTGARSMSTKPTTDPNDAWLKLHIVDGYTVAEAIQTTEQSKSADKQTTAGDLFRALLAEGRRVRAAASGREITHVLLAQRVALVERLPDGMCRVEFCDGSIGTVEAEDMVSVEAVRAEGLP